MGPSSPNDLPDGVDPDDLYEGPKVVSLPSGRASFLADPAEPNRPAQAAALVAPIPAAAPGQSFGNSLAAPVAPVSTAAVKAAYPAALELAWDVLATRVHFFVALVTACLIWAWVIWDPELHRMIAAGAFSVLVVWPMAWIYWKAGMTGNKGS